MSRKTKTTATKEEAKPARVPKLRFPEFRDAGEWEETRLGRMGGLVSGLTYSPDDVRESGLLVLRSSNVQNGGIALDDCVYVDPSIKGANLSRPNDILICVRNGSKALIGKCALISEGMPLCTHGAFMTVFRAHKPNFVFQLFQSDRYQKQVDADLGATINSINGSQLLKYEFSVPSPAEQQKIAECLSSVDELMAAQARKVDALKTHKNGLMQQLFPREGETQPRLRFPEFQNAGAWVSGSLGSIFETTSGGTPSRTEKAYWNGGIPWITTSLVDFRVIDTAEEFITAEGLKNSSAKLFPKGTVLMAMYGPGKTRGQVALLGMEAATNQACAAILPQKGIDPYFVFANLAGRYDEIREMSNSGGQENLSQALVREIYFAFPSDNAEQRKITAFISNLDALITTETQKLGALKTYKKGLMQQLFPSPEEVLG